MPEVFNRDVEDLKKFCDDFKAEMSASQSSGLIRGFIPAEKRRYIELLAMMTKRIEATDFGDFPEVHPPGDAT